MKAFKNSREKPLRRPLRAAFNIMYVSCVEHTRHYFSLLLAPSQAAAGDERPEISLDEEVRRRAERSILNMIAIK